MTIAQAFNEITIAQGGTPNYSGTIASAIDALNDALAGSDQPADTTIEGAVRLLGQHIGGGGSSVEVEALTATENKTYTAPEGTAYSPVTVNVAAQEYDIICKDENDTVVSSYMYPAVFDNDSETYIADKTKPALTKAKGGEIIALDTDALPEGRYICLPAYNYPSGDYIPEPMAAGFPSTIMPAANCTCSIVED